MVWVDGFEMVEVVVIVGECIVVEEENGEREGWRVVVVVAVGKMRKRKRARERMEKRVQRRKSLGTYKEGFLLGFAAITGIAFLVFCVFLLYSLMM